MTPYYQDDAVTLYMGDCRDSLYESALVDHLITDPPYSEHVHSKSMRGATGWKGQIAETRDLGFEALSAMNVSVIAQLCQDRVRRWSAIFSDTESSHRWAQFVAVGRVEYVRTAFWHKVGGAPQFTGDRPAVACEAISLFHPEGKKRWNGGGKQGIYSIPIVLDRGASATEYRCHTAQKPEALMYQLIADFTDAGETVLDPFAGSGTTLIAAKRLGRKAIGIEIKEQYCEVAAKRLSQGALPLEFAR